MIPINRDTLMIIGTVVCIVGILFLFKEMNKTKQEFKVFSEDMIKHLTPRKTVTFAEIESEPESPEPTVPETPATPVPEKHVAQ
jgi:hypothetical protein